MREIPLEVTMSGPDLEAIAAALARVELVAGGQVAVIAPAVVKLTRRRFPADIPDLLARLAQVPFHLAAFGAIYPEWLDRHSPAAPPRFGFGDRHRFHGWACAFRGAGHDRLVSRRWL